MMYILLVDGIVLCRIFPYHLRNVFMEEIENIYLFI